jgi:predicted HTH domain antitoxin
MSLTLPDALFQQIQLSPEELLVELACFLYAQKRLSSEKARKLAKMDVISFQKALAAREIYIHYDEQDLDSDLKNLGISL